MIPCCYFPTTLVMVDDNQPFLSNLALLIDADTPVRIETNPLAAIKYIGDNYLDINFIKTCFSKYSAEEIDDCSSLINKIDITKLLALSKRANRFDSVTLLAVDYTMPEMNGSILCEKLQNLSIKKIMMTAEADLNIAINAFNKNIIDKFILKDSENFHNIFATTIYQLQLEFFIEISRSFIHFAKIENNLWDNQFFIDFFNHLRLKFNIQEFYALDTYGSFLLLDAKGIPIIFAVQSTEQIENYYHIGQENDAHSDVILRLRNKTHFPFFLEEKHLKSPVSTWGDYLHQAQSIPGIKNTFYAIITTEKNHLYFQNHRWIGINDFFNNKT